MNSHHPRYYLPKCCGWIDNCVDGFFTNFKSLCCYSFQDLAVKGVEREVQRLTASHKDELDLLKRQCQEEVDSADTRAFVRYQQRLEDMRQNFTKEKEEACTRERKMASDRYVLIVVNMPTYC